jgi:hypothetical protein
MRLFGAIFRAIWVVAIVTIPSLLLASASQGSLEFALIIGGIVGIFTVFEYGSENPGFVDFRFAPPYNRFRAFTLAIQITAITLVCRAVELDIQNAPILEWAQNAARSLDFAWSPVARTVDLLIEDAAFSDTSAVLLVWTTSVSFVVGFGLTFLFSSFLWVFNWPVDRAHFNLWVNLPMFQPSETMAVPSRLKRDALINVGLSIVLIYALPYALKYGSDLLTADILRSNQAMVWVTTLWVFIPTTLLARASAMWKIARIIRRAQYS